jgi:hypothetical protein
MSATTTIRKAVGYQPFPKQRIFHSAPADEVLYGGSAGPGKTRALLEEAILECLTVPGAQVLFLRREMDQLEQTIERSKTILMPLTIAKDATYNENDHKWTFRPQPNQWCPSSKTGQPELYGSTLLFDSIPSVAALDSHQGPEYDLILFDEATHFPPDFIGFLQTRNRSAVPGPGPRGLNQARMRYASNPGNVAHLYFMAEFVSPLYQDVELRAYWEPTVTGPDGQPGWWCRFPAGATGVPVPETDLPWYNATKGQDQDQELAWWRRTDVPDERLYQYAVWRAPVTQASVERNAERAREGKDPLPRPWRCFIQAFLRDNPIYDADGSYEARLRANPDQNLVRAQLFGRWDVFEGQFFATFNPKLHVIDPFDPPGHWRKWASMDYGSGLDSRFVCQWHTQNPRTEQIMTYREYSRVGASITDQKACDDIMFYTGSEHVDHILADPSMWHGANREKAISLAEQYDRMLRAKGMRLMKANNQRVAGWANWKRLMALRPDPTDPSGERAIPGWVVTSDCSQLIRTIPMQTYHPHNPDDMLKNENDHDCEATRYGLGDRFIDAPRFTKPVKAYSYLRRD